MCLNSYTAAFPDMNEWELDEAAHRFRLLGDPTRLRILQTVMTHGELSVQQIAGLAKASRFNTSAHLNRLALRGMVARRRQGSTVYYRIGDEQLGRLCDAMCASLQVHAGNVSRAARCPRGTFLFSRRCPMRLWASSLEKAFHLINVRYPVGLPYRVPQGPVQISGRPRRGRGTFGPVALRL